MKKSSIEKLHEDSSELISKHLNGELSVRDLIVMHHNLYYEAKQMHKQEIIEARLEPLNMFKNLREKHGYFGGHDNGQVIDREINDSEYYYKNTYEKEN